MVGTPSNGSSAAAGPRRRRDFDRISRATAAALDRLAHHPAIPEPIPRTELAAPADHRDGSPEGAATCRLDAQSLPAQGPHVRAPRPLPPDLPRRIDRRRRVASRRVASPVDAAIVRRILGRLDRALRISRRLGEQGREAFVSDEAAQHMVAFAGHVERWVEAQRAP